MSVLCIACQKEVDGHRHSISCDVCERWQHRLCGTGIVFFIYILYYFCLFVVLFISVSSCLQSQHVTYNKFCFQIEHSHVAERTKNFIISSF